MKSLLTAIVFLATLFCFVVPVEAQQWATYEPQGAGYRIEFPGHPKIMTKEVQTADGPMKMFIAFVERGSSTSFMAIHSVLPSQIDADPQVLIDMGRDQMVQSMKGVVREEARLSIGGAPARRLVVDLPNKTVMTGLFVSSGMRLYQVVVGAPAGKEGSPDIGRFLNSFALVAAAKQ